MDEKWCGLLSLYRYVLGIDMTVLVSVRYLNPSRATGSESEGFVMLLLLVADQNIHMDETFSMVQLTFEISSFYRLPIYHFS